MIFRQVCYSLQRYSVLRLFSSNVTNVLPDLDLDYLCNPSNTAEIRENIQKRKGVGDIDKVIELHNVWQSSHSKEQSTLKEQLIQTALKIPNKSHPDISTIEEEPLVVRIIGEDRVPQVKAVQFHDISNNLNICRTEKISNYTGARSYYFLDDLVAVEQALIKYTLDYLNKLNFNLISVPDILPRTIIESCGMDTRGERNQVYSLSDKSYGDLCLSGTAEIGIGYFLRGKRFKKEDLPMKFTAVSRCFRAETSKVAEEKGVYRVHEFTKVEMFGVSLPEFSDTLLDEFVTIQENIYDSLGLKLRTLDMPPAELGAQAARKYDIEAWLPGRQMWGEISSASNCTDYQSRRLAIRTKGGYVHTLNGTACAVPRLIIALLETHQKDKNLVEFPEVLKPYLGFSILRPSRVPKLAEFKTREKFV